LLSRARGFGDGGEKLNQHESCLLCVDGHARIASESRRRWLSPRTQGKDVAADNKANRFTTKPTMHKARAQVLNDMDPQTPLHR
jgi:hypothetical protein